MKTQDALNILGLPVTSTLEDIKSAYRKACKIYHPDINPAGLEMMKAVNSAFESLKDYAYSPDRTYQASELDYGSKLNTALNAIINFDVSIEVCGAWVWVTGNTFTIKDKLKALGFKFAIQKKAWYFRPEKYRSASRGGWSLDEIREKHGSQKIHSESQKMLQ